MRRRESGVRVLGVLALALVACTPGGEGAAVARSLTPLEPRTRDSAGVTLWEHSADALARAPLITLDTIPFAMRVGAADDLEHDITALRGWAFLSDGRLVAHDADRGTIVVFSPTLGARIDWSGLGSGPRELSRGSSITGIVRDTIVVSDDGNGRLALVSPESGVIETVPYRRQLDVIGRDADGRVLGTRSEFAGFSDSDDELRRAPVTVLGWRLDAARFDTILVAEGRALALRPISRDGQVVGIRGIEPLFGTAPRLRQWDDRVLVAAGDEWILDRHDMRGALRERIRIAVPPVRSNDSLVRLEIASALEAAAEYTADSLLPSKRGELEARPVAEHLPAYSDVQLTPGGVAWVLDYRLSWQVGWAATVVDRQGRILGRVAMDGSEAPIAFGDDRLLFRSTDADGIATLRVLLIGVPER